MQIYLLSFSKTTCFYDIKELETFGRIALTILYEWNKLH